MPLLNVADTAYAFRIIKILTTKWEDTDAFKSGVIDDTGKLLIPIRSQTPEQKNTYTLFHRLVYNLKRVISKAPGGKTKLGSYAAALFLVKENFQLTDEELFDIMDSSGIDVDPINESTWFQRDDCLIAGKYKLNSDMVVNSTIEEVAKKNSVVIVERTIEPESYINDCPVYKVIHEKTNQELFVSQMDIRRGIK